MSSLDARARRSAESIHESVADYTPAAPIPVLRKRQTVWNGAGYSILAAGFAMLIALVTWWTVPVPSPDAAENTEPSTTLAPTTTIAATEEEGTDGEPSVVPPPVTAAPTPEAPIVEETTPTSVATTSVTTTSVTTTEAPDTTPPPLTITTPEDGAHFEEEVVTFAGTTEPGATVVAGGRYAASVDGAGHWSIQLVLALGANGASFVATDEAGNQTTAKIVVHLDEKGEEEPPPPPPEVEFTANSTFGSCNENPPYDVYFGTADPETKVTINSEYGSGSTYANGEGEWEVKVFFPEAPFNVTFPVTVKDHTGKKKTFEFVSNFEG
jgi:hypothetical protein